MNFWCKCILLVSICSLANTHKLPSNLKVCKRDGDFQKCIKNALPEALMNFKNGYPNLKLPAIDPLFLPSLTIGAGTGTVHVEQKFKNVNYFGISTMQIEAIDVVETPTSAKIIVDGFIDDLQLKADYEMNGQVLVLPVVGNGTCVVTLYKLKIKLVLDGELIEKKDEKYLKVKNSAISLSPGKLHYRFENLFGGDKALSDQIHKVLNDNWKDVFEDVKASYEESFRILALTFSKKVFNNFPYDTVFPK